MIRKCLFSKWRKATNRGPSDGPSVATLSPFHRSGAELKPFYFIFLAGCSNARTPTRTLAVKRVSSSAECDCIVLHSSASGHRVFESSCKLCPKSSPAVSFAAPRLFSLFSEYISCKHLMKDSCQLRCWLGVFFNVHKPVLTSSGHEFSSVLRLN